MDQRFKKKSTAVRPRDPVSHGSVALTLIKKRHDRVK